jgi:hypothetical protein
MFDVVALQRSFDLDGHQCTVSVRLPEHSRDGVTLLWLYELEPPMQLTDEQRTRMRAGISKAIRDIDRAVYGQGRRHIPEPRFDLVEPVQRVDGGR